jgi:hypothetical protein
VSHGVSFGKGQKLMDCTPNRGHFPACYLLACISGGFAGLEDGLDPQGVLLALEEQLEESRRLRAALVPVPPLSHFPLTDKEEVGEQIAEPDSVLASATSP